MRYRTSLVLCSFFVAALPDAEPACAQFPRLQSDSDIKWLFEESSAAYDHFQVFRSDDRISTGWHSNPFPITRENSSLSEILLVSQEDQPSECAAPEGPGDPNHWSTTEVQFQYGRLDAPSFAGGQSSDTKILTLQHASGWKYGDNYFFVDMLRDNVGDGFNDGDVYLEWYANFSLGKILDRKVGFGPISDVGVLAGINNAADADVLKWLPGIRLAWDVPGFAFFNTDFTAYLDDSRGAIGGGAPAETDGFMIDFNWARPFSIGRHDFIVEGHAEFIGGRRNEFGDDVNWWILAQPQFRYDLGKTVLGSANQLFVGIEWQVWTNKLGDASTDENAIQALVVWRF